MQGCLSLAALGSKGPAPPRDLQCAETCTDWIRLTFHPGSTRCLSKVQKFAVRICGGPAGDLRGPREEIVPSPGGSGRITCDITGLIPSTEYTITISAVTKSGKRSDEVSLEVRTADEPANGQSLGKADLGYNKGSPDPKDKTQKPYNNQKEKQAPLHRLAPGTVQVNLSSNRQPDREDDTSTVAPSEHEEEETAQRDTSMSDDEEAAAGACPSTHVVAVQRDELQREEVPVLSSSSCAAAVPTEPHVIDTDAEEELKEPPQCKLCSILDCLKQKGPKPAQNAEVVVDVTVRDPVPASSSSACAAEIRPNRPNPPAQGSNQRQFRPNRPPFPGRPISYEPITR
eukprot:gnl/MRDRNA2_/MRDRNA2_105053_c0_seq1.p1 gnl/MRDRNA2_/MRDRNA2_105053_c0~~gnl/MRDRNA2_/MRDRNA2_105053_c0_seq1.p1  ORF type:complete len:343 (-),score=70.10 gnl/MRDRNA2_/MRDRNA2_105053_c0_seq1:76-1104(-)